VTAVSPQLAPAVLEIVFLIWLIQVVFTPRSEVCTWWVFLKAPLKLMR